VLKSRSSLMIVAMVFLIITVFQPGNVLAQGPLNNINEKLDSIQATLDTILEP
jgi:hypothetical protein